MIRFFKKLFSNAHELYSWHKRLDDVTKHQFIDYIEQCRLHLAAEELRQKTNREIIEMVRFILENDKNIKLMVRKELERNGSGL